MIIDMKKIFTQLSVYLDGAYDWDYIETICAPLKISEDYKDWYIRHCRTFRILRALDKDKCKEKIKCLKTRKK